MGGTFFIRLTFFHIIFTLLFLSGCASSKVSRDVSENIDIGAVNTARILNSEPSFSDSYQNTSQQKKGMIIGASVGALSGWAASTVAILPGAMVGAVIGSSYGTYIDQHTTLKDKLINRGINIVILGDEILLVLPSSILFHEQSSKIKQSAYSTLALVSDFINQYTKTLVKVAAYTNGTGAKEVDLALSKKQAQNLANFLSTAGLDARLLYADGYGASNLVEPNTLAWHGSDNYRIEITLQKLYV